ncbi:hypothetical protein V6N13_057402 [Hibiscus sabdariffa]
MSNPPGMVGRRARKRMSGAANDSTTKFPISGKVPLEWLMHRLASPSPGHAQSEGGHCHSQYWQTLRGNSIGGVSRPSNVRASDLIKSQWELWCALTHCFLCSSTESIGRVGCGPVGVDAAAYTQWACEW